MALSDASSDPLALSNGGHHHHFGANGNTSTPVNNGHDPLALAPSGDCPTPGRDDEVVGKDTACIVQQKQQRLRGVQRTNGLNQSQNCGVVKQNGSLRNLPPSFTAASSTATLTNSQILAKSHLPSTLSMPSSSPSVQPLPLRCQHCHFHSTLCCSCGQQECPLFQSPGAGPGPGSIQHPGTTSSCTCCLSACTYSHHQPHPPHSPSSFCFHHHHQQSWQERLQNQTPGIRYEEELLHSEIH